MRNATDVLDGIGWFRSLPATPRGRPADTAAGLQEPARTVFEQLGFEAVSVEQLSRDTGLEPAALQGCLTQLELEGLIARVVDGIVRS